MSEASWPTALAKVLAKEGGYSNNPHDPGKATNFGITQSVYNSWRGLQHQLNQPVRAITQTEISSIYHAQYWLPAGCGGMWAGLDNCVFDEAVNSGVGRSVRDLQVVLQKRGIYSGKVDGVVGLMTLHAVAQVSDRAGLINDLCSLRLSWLHRLATWRFFGPGWASRIASVRKESLSMI